MTDVDEAIERAEESQRWTRRIDVTKLAFEDRVTLAAEVKRLREEVESESVSRRANSRSARALMDAIRDDPAFPGEEDPALFGERALAVIARLREDRALLAAEVKRLRATVNTEVEELAEGEADVLRQMSGM